jgi:hypothetical protein
MFCFKASRRREVFSSRFLGMLFVLRSSFM